MNASDLLTTVVLILSIINVLGLIVVAAEVGRLHLRIDPSRADLPLVPDEGLGLGDTAAARLPRPISTSYPELGTGLTLVAFLSTTCQPCVRLWPDLVRVARSPEVPTIRVTVIVSGRPDESIFSDADLPASVRLVDDRSGVIGNAFEVRRTPFLFVLENGDVRGKGVANNYVQLVSLLEGHRGHPTQASAWQATD